MTTERETLAAFMLDARMGLAADKPSPYGEMADRLSGAVLTSDWLTAHTATKVNAAVEAAAGRVEDGCTHSMHHGPCARCQDAARAVRGDS